MARDNRKPPQREELPELLTAIEATEFLNLWLITLSRQRYQGRGPIYCKHGWRVYYPRADLVDWFERQRWASTGVPLRS
ncbi:helix-turn-helix domain-containing protein [Hyphomonas sp.]|uniref:helix-turn-helix domain-containing protein n=1 Tax=Hyphomonas sp. TaxID=87 RepID=UPI00356AC8FB